MKYKKVLIASDHAGFPLKQHFLAQFKHWPWIDLGPTDENSVDYPDFADKLVTQIDNGETLGVLVCGSGQGMAMRANKYSHIRAALCWNEEVAKLAREHNNANVICFGARLLPYPDCDKILRAFVETEFAGGRHQGRVEKVNSPLKRRS